ncbi:hypothetical protein [Parvibaculum sp.]|uniref:hypothetical protein n=1 Tax=Parvibaculum sp. TaxID=2024848 RepID=UPI001B2B3EBD|nr:hypothetical protein [Parvibaculum sp.]MBO6668250.1 hypothetical protein [Parvibaculum sp.]MBO6690994.1 hypothetical protein [Parvibaculum sp.]MBO6714632.1 hypothetical protein [Parvibaculum sp.]
MPYTYCVTFRIADKTVGGKNYSQRREQLVENVHTEGLGYWEETTSFFLVESTEDTPSFARKAAKGLSERDDLLVAFDPSDMSAAYFGPLEHVDVLASFFTSLKRVP